MSRRAVLLFVALGLIWGIPYLLIKVAVAEVEPTVLVFVRCAVAAVLVLPVALVRCAVVPALRRWRPVLAYTAAEIVVPWIFLARAEQELPSSLAGLLLATVPVVGVGIALLTRRSERLGTAGAVGIGVGLLGVALLVGFDVGVTSDGAALVAVAEIGLVVLGYAIGPVIMSRHMADLPSSGVVAVSLCVAALVYLPFALTSWPTGWPSPEAIWSMTVLAVLCTAVAFGLLFALVAEVGPVRATVITYLNPAVAVVAGVVLLDEPLTPFTVTGFVLIITGSVLATRHPRALVEKAPVAAG